MLRILIISDSRGSALQKHIFGSDEFSFPAIEELSKTCSITIQVFKGATLERLENKISNISKQKYYHLIILLGGICNLTTVTIERGLKLLHYISDTARTDSIKHTLTRLDKRYKAQLHIGRIVPACLEGYFEHHNPGKSSPPYLSSQQEQLNNDLEDLNSFITSINNNRGQERIDLDTKVHKASCKSAKTKGGRRKRAKRQVIQKDLLPDGVHPSSELTKKWINRLASVLEKWAENKTTEQPEISSQESDSDREPEAWRYKRGPKRP